MEVGLGEEVPRLVLQAQLVRGRVEAVQEGVRVHAARGWTRQETTELLGSVIRGAYDAQAPRHAPASQSSVVGQGMSAKRSEM